MGVISDKEDDLVLKESQSRCVSVCQQVFAEVTKIFLDGAPAFFHFLFLRLLTSRVSNVAEVDSPSLSALSAV